MNKYLAWSLLMVFAWSLLPSHTLHDLFADHDDTEHGYCAKYHSHLGTHVEKKHTHCDFLDTNTPIYDKPTIVAFGNVEAIYIAEINTSFKNVYFNSHLTSVPARGPPALV